MNLLKVSQLSVTYQSTLGGWRRSVTKAVDSVSFSVNPGEIVAVVGESGSGKTTVARAVAGLLKPSAGTIALNGKEIGRLSARDREQRAAIQMVFQDPRASLNPRRTVAQSLEEALEKRAAVPGSDPVQRVADLLSAVGLESVLADRYPGQISGGQCQRVCIARAIASSPALLVCDEAVSALDVTVQAQVLRLLSEIRERTGVAMLFITHDLGVVRQIADRVIVMNHGQVVEEGRVASVLDAPTDLYTQQLLAAALDLPVHD